jgi:hypothetical protein
MLGTLVNQLGQELEMQDLILNSQEGVYFLPFDENIEIYASQLPHSYLFKGNIGPCPKTNPAPFLTRILELNLFGKGTRNAIIGLSEDENMLTLSMELDYNSSYKEFKEKLEDFVSVIDFWRNEALRHQ